MGKVYTHFSQFVLKCTLLSLLLLAFTQDSFAQISPASEGRDFWFGYYDTYFPDTFKVYITAKQNASGTISVPGKSYSKSFSVTANTTFIWAIPSAKVDNFNVDSFASTGVHVTSNADVTVFASMIKNFGMEGTMILPTPLVSNNPEYIIPSFTTSSSFFPTGFLAVASEDSTKVEVLLTADANGNKKKNIPFTFYLDKGEIYQIRSANDISGSRVRVVNGCKPLSVFAGHSCAYVDDNTCFYCNYLLEQVIPNNYLGKNYIVLPFKGQSSGYLYRVMALEDGTTIKVDGTTTNLNAGKYKEVLITSYKPSIVSSNKTVSVYNMMRGNSCNGSSVGDPSMVMVYPNEQASNEATFATLNNSAITNHYVSVLIKSKYTSLLRLDDKKITTATFVSIGSGSGYAYIAIPIATGSHKLSCDSGFLAYCYGVGAYESYSYSVGGSYENKNYNFDYTPTQICTNDTVTFTAFGDSVSAFNWKYNDNKTDTGKVIQRAFTKDSTYTLRLVVDVKNACLYDTITKDVLVKFPAEYDLPSDTALCKNTVIALQGKITNNYIGTPVYIWRDLTSNSADTTFGDTGTYYHLIDSETVIRLSLADGCHYTDMNIHLFSDPDVSLPTDTMLCKGINAINFATALGGDTTHYQYTWYKNGLYYDTGLVTSDTLGKQDSIYHQLILFDGCKNDTATMVVHVKAPIQAMILGDTINCQGNTSTLSLAPIGNPPGTYNYLWSIYNNTTLQYDSVSNTKLLTLAGGTTYQMQGIIDDGCAEADTAYWQSFPINALAITTNANDTSICFGSSISATFNGQGGDTGSYEWSGSGIGNVYTYSGTPTKDTILQVTLGDNYCLTDTVNIKIIVHPPLKVSLGKDTTVCAGTAIVLRANATGSNPAKLIYQWLSGAQLIGNTKNLNISFDHTTDTLITIAVYDSCSALPVVDSIWIHVNPPLTLSIPNDTVTCWGNTVSMSGKGSGGNLSYTYLWERKLGNGNWVYHTSGPNIQLTSTKPSTGKELFTLRCILKDNCSPNDTEEINITFNPKLKIIGVGDTLLCSGVINTITSFTSEYIPDLQWSWVNTKTRALLSQSNIFSFYGDTAFAATVYVKDSICFYDSLTIKTSISPPLALYLIDSPKICQLPPFRFIAKATGGHKEFYKFTWSDTSGTLLGNDDTLFLNEGIHSPVVLRISDGCSHDTTKLLQLKAYEPPAPNFSLSDTIGCVGKDMVFNNESIIPAVSQPYKWIWNYGDRTTDTVYSNTFMHHRYPRKGLYTVSLTAIDSSGCDSSISKVNYIQVNPSPKALFTADPAETSIDSPTISLYNKSKGGVGFEWVIGQIYDAFTSDSITPIVYTFKDTGVYKTALIAINKYSCYDTAIKDLIIYDPLRIYIPNSFSPNNNNINEVFMPSVMGHRTFHMLIYNRWGQLVADLNDAAWDGKGMPTDVYYYMLFVTGRDYKTVQRFGMVHLLR
jgi:gliding motility-associated-like protein